MRFTDFLTQDSIRPSLPARNGPEVLYELAALLAPHTASSPQVLGALLSERELLSSTSVEGGVALPHCRLKELPRIAVCVGLHPGGLAFGPPEHGRVRIFVGVVSPLDTAGLHLNVLARVAGMMREPALREGLLGCSTAPDIFSFLVEAEEAYVERLVARPSLVLAEHT